MSPHRTRSPAPALTSALASASLLALGLALARCGAAAPATQTTTTMQGTAEGQGATMATPSGNEALGPDAGATASAQLPTVGPDAGTAVVPPPSGFVVAPMHLLPAPGATGEDALVDLELHADGTLSSHGQFVGQLSGDRVLGADGREVLSVSPEGVVSIQGRATQLRLSPEGDLMLPNGASLGFDASGAAMMAQPGRASQRGPARLEGYRADARRTAGLLALIVATTGLARPAH